MNEIKMNTSIRVACIGNMNNNYFSLMRYLRVLGVDAYLLMYRNEHDLFQPGNDTWEIEKWQPYIKKLDLYNNEWKWLKVKPNEINEKIQGYDIYIGCGVTPAYFHKAKRKLDIFTPYSGGIEFINTAIFDPKHPRSSLQKLYVRRFQEKGIKNTWVVTTVQPFFFRNFNNIYKKLKIKPIPFPIPLLFNLEETDHLQLEQDEDLSKYLHIFKKKDLVVHSHSRQMWKTLPHYYKNPLSGKKRLEAKRNDILIEGFALYVKAAKYKEPLLVLAEYGEDVENSKSLISRLGITHHVLWLPRMPRKKLMKMLEYVDIGADQFANSYWGGTGMEILSMGKPLMNHVAISDEKYKEITGHELPFVLRAHSPEEVCGHLLDFEKNRDYYIEAGKKNKDWFDKYIGIGLTKKFKQIIEYLYKEKTKNR